MLAAFLAALATQPAAAEAAALPLRGGTRTLSTVDEHDLLLFSVQLDQLTLTETLSAYGDANDPLISVGELARLLDLDLHVSPSEQRISGTLGQAQKPVILDFRATAMRLGGAKINLLPDDVAYSEADIFVRASALQRFLPIRFEVSAEALAIRLHATEKLPVQERLERFARLRGLDQSVAMENEPPIVVNTPYRLFSPPSFDVVLEAGRDTRTLQPFSRRYDVRFAGDFLYANLQGFVGADDRGRPQSARFVFERTSAAGALPFGATRISAGDVYTPALPVGVRSIGGRGLSFTTVPAEEASVFDTIDLRGELPIGFDVELYINDILRGGERTPVEGRYEFLNVPLVRGVNVIRIVSYGPRGERSEAIRVVNVGGGQVRGGESQVEVGLVEQGRALVALGPSADSAIIAEAVGPRLVASAAYGLSDSVTFVAGGAAHRTISKDNRGLATLGVRTSLAGMAVRGDAAIDSSGGTALALGVAGQPFGVSVVLQHNEYRGRFFDETIATLDLGRPRVRHSAVTLDLGLPPIGGRRIPVSLRAVRDEFADGGSGWIATLRASATLLNALVSAGLDYQRNTSAAGTSDERLTGNVAASKFVNFKWQFRSTVDFDLRPAARLRALSLTADRSLSDRLALRFGLGQTLAEKRDTFGQVGAVFRLPVGELSLNGDYSVREGDWRLAVRFGFGSIFNPFRRQYVMTPPGAASGATAFIRAFLDRDGDSRFGPGDEPAPGIVIEGGRDKAVTDERGTALVTGLGTAPSVTLTLNTNDFDQLYARGASSQLRFEPRAGQVAQIMYPMEPMGEVYARFVTVKGGTSAVGLSALRVRLTAPGHSPITGTTEYDGSIVFSDVPLGTYRLELDAEQAARLRMKMREELTVSVEADKASEVQGTVDFVGPNAEH